MSITFPDWYVGGYPSTEVTAKAILDPYLAQITGGVDVYSWLPATDHTNPTGWAEHLPFVLVFRSGLVKPNDLVDYGKLEVVSFADSRADSEDLSAFVREVFWAHRNGCIADLGGGKKATVASVDLIAGQDLRPDSAFDKRATFATYCLGVRKPMGVPDYESLLQRGLMD